MIGDRVAAFEALDASWQARYEAQVASLVRSIERRDAIIEHLLMVVLACRATSYLSTARGSAILRHVTAPLERDRKGLFLKEGVA